VNKQSILSEEFLSKYKNKQPNWGFNGLGYIVYKRTYARPIHGDDGKILRTEEWWETVARCIGGAQKIGANYTKKEAERLYDYIFNLKCSFSGRGLWQLGTKTVDIVGNDSLLNCWVTKVSTIDDFCFIFTESMLGGGVGAVISKEYTHELPRVKQGVRCELKNTKDADFIIPDSKEGWCMLWRKLLEAYLMTGKSFTYSAVCIRSSGEPLKTFGGIAPGPKPLIDGAKELCLVLEKRVGKKLRTQDVCDIICCGGQVVKSGGIRRTALILQGDVDDMSFLKLKRWDLGNIPNYRANSNNSLLCSNYDHILDEYWNGFLGNGEPYGLINIKNCKRHGRTGEEKIGDFDLYDESIIGVNPCVSGDTEILTKNGYFPIEKYINEKIEIWNGFEWSMVTPKITGKNQPMLKIGFSDGRKLKCTKYHKFNLLRNYTGDSFVKIACQLQVGDKLIKHNLPILENGEFFKQAYSQGFYSGDGTKNSNTAYIYEPKFCVISNLDGKLGKEYNTYSGVKRRLFSFNFKLYPKNFVPFYWNLESKLNWIAGLLDADGCELKEGGAQLISIDIEFLNRFQKLLSTIGIQSKITNSNTLGFRNLPDGHGNHKLFLCQESKRISISSIQIQNLIKLGLKCKRLSFNKKPNRDASQYVKVSSVAETSNCQLVYCFNEPKRHTALFNGIITGQCAEATISDKENCNLSELFLNNISTKEEMLDCATLLYKTQKAIASGKYLHDDTTKIVHKNMRLGLGITGICQKLDVIKEWCNYTYNGLRKFDKEYSEEHKYPQSIRLTVTKPSGSLSLLSGSTPGVHPGYSRYHIRRIRFSSTDSLIPILRDAGYKVSPEIQFDGTQNHDILIVDFPCSFSKDTICEDMSNVIDQLERLKLIQECWADQAVSNTIYFKKEDVPLIKEWLKKNYNSCVKSVSFLLHSGHGFLQAPYEPISKDKYLELKSHLKPIKYNNIIDKGNEIQDSLECDGGHCPVK
jgi:intein/homing endonuclease